MCVVPVQCVNVTFDVLLDIVYMSWFTQRPSLCRNVFSSQSASDSKPRPPQPLSLPRPSSSLHAGIDFKIKTIELEGKRIKLQIWYTS